MCAQDANKSTFESKYMSAVILRFKVTELSGPFSGTSGRCGTCVGTNQFLNSMVHH